MFDICMSTTTRERTASRPRGAQTNQLRSLEVLRSQTPAEHHLPASGFFLMAKPPNIVVFAYAGNFPLQLHYARSTQRIIAFKAVLLPAADSSCRDLSTSAGGSAATECRADRGLLNN